MNKRKAFSDFTRCLFRLHGSRLLNGIEFIVAICQRDLFEPLVFSLRLFCPFQANVSLRQYVQRQAASAVL